MVAYYSNSRWEEKEDRIRGLVPEYSNNEWFWPEKDKLVRNSLYSGKNYDLTVEMENELSNFPLGQHDDLMDVMTLLNRLDIVKPKEHIEKVIDTRMTFGDLHQMMDDRKRAQSVKTFVRASYV